MPRKGRRSQAQKLRWTKLDLTGQTGVSKTVDQFSNGQHGEDGDNTSRILSVQASHCQSDARYDVFSRNHQCTCVALTFLAYHSEGTLFKQPDLDTVLEEGDGLYVGIKMQLIAEGRFRRNHLSMGEVPVSITTSNHTYIIQKSEVLMGYLRARGTPEMERWWIPLNERLQCLSTDVSNALLMVSPECFAVFRDGSGRYGYFDSHSRTAEGFPHPTGDGTAVMLSFTDLNDMTSRLLQLFQNRGAETCYEFMPVAFEMEQLSEKPCSSSACVSPLQVTSSLPKTQTNADVRIPEHLVITDDGDQSITRVIKTNKQRRRKEMRKIVHQKQEAGLEKTNPHFEVREQKRREYEREKYATNLQFRVKKMENAKKKYDQNPFARHKKMEYITRRYNTDVLFQKNQKGYINRRYHTDALFQKKMKDHMIRRYKTDKLFQKKMKDYMVRRYKTDDLFQKKMKDYMVRRYKTDDLFQKKTKDYMVRRYKTDDLFQKKTKDYMVRRYKTDDLFKMKMKDYMQPEKHYGRLVKLYVPHRFNEQLKPQRYPTYQEFYKGAFVELPAYPGILMPVCAIVKTHQEKYEKHSKEVDQAFEQLQREGPSENAWTAFAPEIDVDRLECIAEQEDVDPGEEDVQDDVPEYQILREDGDGVVPQIEAPQMTAEFAVLVVGNHTSSSAYTRKQPRFYDSSLDSRKKGISPCLRCCYLRLLGRQHSTSLVKHCIRF
ncbi:replicase helicase endonuclease [Labeo rohita]|uniref:Replicase helicase endonuclease n=1 Tax=Labeo rohita TaxID=84645 RepID=A0A498NZW2_LABRO|nr:replicase helicase endonuclease [Labeo rohita]